MFIVIYDVERKNAIEWLRRYSCRHIVRKFDEGEAVKRS